MVPLKLERLSAGRVSLSREFQSDTEDGIEDLHDISVRVKGITRLLLFLSGYWVVSLTKGGVKSQI